MYFYNVQKMNIVFSHKFRLIAAFDIFSCISGLLQNVDFRFCPANISCNVQRVIYKVLRINRIFKPGCNISMLSYLLTVV